jgi:hypothetical protein
MTLGDMFILIKFICNKDYSGNIVTPERFNMLIKVVSIELFRNKYGIPEEYQPGRPIPLEYADITLKNTDDLKAFKVRVPNRSVANGVMLFPADYAHRETLVYNYSKTINNVATPLPRPVEILREAEFAAREGNYTKRPTIQNPICVLRNDGIHIRPITITAVDFNYYRFPVDPVFDYSLGDGTVTYNASTSVEPEFTKDEMFTFTKMVLSLVGINLREEQVIQYAEQKLKTP